MVLNPFQWGQGGQKLSPAQVAEQRRVAQALAARGGVARNVGEGLGRVGEALMYRSLTGRADEAETAGRATANQAFESLFGTSDPVDVASGGVREGSPTIQELFGLVGNEWASPQQQSVAQALLSQQLQQQDPMYQANLERTNLELEAMRNPSAETPDVETFYDPETGSPYKAQWNSQTGTWDPVGGTEAVGAPTVQKVTLEDGSEMAVQWDSASSQWVPIDAPEGGGTLTAPGDLTESQSKLVLFETLQTETQPVLNDLERQYDPSNIQDAAARATPIAGNFFQTEQGQIYNAAASAWAEGALRVATGAAATPEEMERTKATYFAQPGDTPNTIMFKAQLRDMYSRAINNSLSRPSDGGSLPLPSEFASQAEEQLSGGGVTPPQPGEEQDGYRFKGGDPADPNNWERVQ